MSTQLSTRRAFPDFADVRSRLDRLFEDITGPLHADGSWTMAMDVKRTDDAMTLTADVPGIKPEDLSISVEDGMLTVAGRHQESTDEEREGYVRRERRIGTFRRTLALPAEAKIEEIAARTQDGVVTITVPLGQAKPSGKVEITPEAG